MKENRVKKFRDEREKLNKIVMKYAGLNTKRFYHIDSLAYQDGALPARTKEMLGLATSLVLRCDDCIMYHLIRCREEGVTSEELEELCSVSMVVGGSITIPHLRRLWRAWDEMKNNPAPRKIRGKRK